MHTHVKRTLFPTDLDDVMRQKTEPRDEVFKRRQKDPYKTLKPQAVVENSLRIPSRFPDA